MNEQTQKIECTVQILTPVHIGSGVRLAVGIDYYTDKNNTYIVPQKTLMDFLKDNFKKLRHYHEPSMHATLLSEIPKNECIVYNWRCTTDELYEFERNSFGTPYLPGSSLKGAFRTALFAQSMRNRYNKNDILNSNVSSPDSKATTEVFVSNASLERNPSSKNIMRMLRIGDVAFQQNDLELAQFQILNCHSENGKWKWKGAPMKLIVETLSMDAESRVNISIDGFLFQNKDAQSTLRFPKTRIEDIFKKVNTHYKQLIKSEIRFFEKLNENKENTHPLDSLIDELNEIKSLFPADETKESTECVLRLGWGTGWRTMTGNWIPEIDLLSIKERFKLGKHNVNIFPKTRKLIINGEDYTVSGWVKLTRI